MPPSSFTDSVQRYDGERRKRDRGGAKAGDLPPRALADYVGLLRNVARDRMHCHWGCSLLHGRSQVSSPSLAHEEGETAHYLHNRCIGHTPGTVRLGPPLCTLHADQDAGLLQVPTCHRRPRYRFAAMGDQNGKWSGPKSTTRFDSECVRSLPRRLHPPASAVARPDQDPLPPSYPRAERLEKQM